MKLEGKTILVTGASKGIGKALVERLTKEDCHIILVARTETDLKLLVSKYGSNLSYYICDLSDRDSILQLTRKIKQNVKKLDILINVAGIGIYKPIKNASIEEWDSSLALNITGPFILIKNLLPLLENSADALVLNIGTGAGVMAMKNRSLYCATKFALRGLTLSLAEEFESKSPSFRLITLGSTITGFGGKSIEEKRQEMKEGRAYFPVEWVANKLIEIIKGDLKEAEYVLYPGDYGFGTWKKP